MLTASLTMPSFCANSLNAERRHRSPRASARSHASVAVFVVAVNQRPHLLPILARGWRQEDPPDHYALTTHVVIVVAPPLGFDAVPCRRAKIAEVGSKEKVPEWPGLVQDENRMSIDRGAYAFEESCAQFCWPSAGFIERCGLSSVRCGENVPDHHEHRRDHRSQHDAVHAEDLESDARDCPPG